MPSPGPLGVDRDAHCAVGQIVQHLLDQRQALVDLLDTDQGTRVDVAVVQHRHLEVQPIIGRIADRPARVEIASRRAADIAAGTEAARQLGRQDAGADRAVLQRRGLVVELHQRGKARAYPVDQRSDAGVAIRVEIDRGPMEPLFWRLPYIAMPPAFSSHREAV